MRKTYSALDITKFILAYMVVTVHCLNFELKENTIWFLVEHYILRMSVPLFFLMSGFFLGLKVKKCEEQKWEYIKGNIKNLMIHYLFWNVVYGAIGIIFGLRQGAGIGWVVFEFIRNSLTFNATLMWYIGSLVFSILVIGLIKSKNGFKQSLLVAILLYVVGILMGSYSGIFRGTGMESVLATYYHFFVNSSNGLFVGYVFVGFGYYYARYSEEEPGRRNLFLSVLIGYIVLTIEMLLIRQIPAPMEGNYDFLLGNLIVTPPIFLLVLQCKVKENISTVFLRKASSCIYFTHMAILSAVNFVFDIAFGYKYILVVVLVTVCAYVVYKWNNKYVNMIT